MCVCCILGQIHRKLIFALTGRWLVKSFFKVLLWSRTLGAKSTFKEWSGFLKQPIQFLASKLQLQSPLLFHKYPFKNTKYISAKINIQSYGPIYFMDILLTVFVMRITYLLAPISSKKWVNDCSFSSHIMNTSSTNLSHYCQKLLPVPTSPQINWQDWVQISLPKLPPWTANKMDSHTRTKFYVTQNCKQSRMKYTWRWGSSLAPSKAHRTASNP